MAAQSTQSTPSAPAPASGSNRHPPASVANTKGIVPGNIVVVKSLAYNGVTWVAIGPDGQNFGMTEAIVVYRSPGQTCHFGNDLQCLTVSMVEKVPAAPGCGAINEALTLSDRRWVCDCGMAHDRDLCAAVNIRDEGFRMLAEGHSDNSNVRGRGVRLATASNPG